jgi:glycosyltransferase involved in cell wall biosynthesis
VGYPAHCAAKKLGKPLFVKIVGDYAWEQGVQRFGVTASLDEFVQTKKVPAAVRVFRRVQMRVALGAKKIIVPSLYLKEIVAQWGIPEEKIVVIYNGIEIPTHIPAHAKNEEEFLIVSAGRRVPWKGFEAIERVAQEHPNWRIFIASGLSREEALGWMKAADVFVLNSRYEGFSHALIEAMTLGTPVIATDAGGNRELVGESGLLVPVADDAELERALEEVAGHSDRARERARAAQGRMHEFSLPQMLDSTAAFLKNYI